MSADLGKDWEPGPVLGDPGAIHAHLGVAVEPDERWDRAVRVVICDDRRRVLAHVHVDSVPAASEPADCAAVLNGMLGVLPDFRLDLAVLVALIRPGPDTVTDAERRWFRAAHRICAGIEVPLLGVHLMVPTGIREISIDDVIGGEGRLQW